MSLGALSFLNPWLLLAGLALPAIWWLLRTTPPGPKRIAFPPTRILKDVENKERTPSRSPWWLTALRMLAATLIILALADPVLNPDARRLSGSGSVVLFIDNSWAAANAWQQRSDTVSLLIAEAEKDGRSLMIVPTAEGASRTGLSQIGPAEARQRAGSLKPEPFAPNQLEAAKAVRTALAGATAEIVWLTDDLEHPGSAAAVEVLQEAAANGSLTLIAAPGAPGALGLAGKAGQGGRLEAIIMRPSAAAATSGMIHALSARGERLSEATFELATGETRQSVTLSMPLELRNQVSRIEIAGNASAGSVHLLDARSRWNRVGLVSGVKREQAQPLLSPLHYLERALRPYTELVLPNEPNVTSAVNEMLEQNVSVLVLADIGKLIGVPFEQIEAWMEKGGVLVRFAGARLEQGNDELLPVALRLGGRNLGGALSWDQPQALAPFDDDSAFAGLAVPGDVRVQRQVLADPTRLGSDTQVWARLSDGTPLVTAQRRKDGWIILFHITANTDWSNLPLSGLFVEMLRRITTLSSITATSGVTGSSDGAVTDVALALGTQSADRVLSPTRTLDGYGRLGSPPAGATPLSMAQFDTIVPSALYPPGFYGPTDASRSLNLVTEKTELAQLTSVPSGTARLGYVAGTAQLLKPWCFAIALLALLIDVIAVLVLQTGLTISGSGIGRGGKNRSSAALGGTASMLALALTTGAALLATLLIFSPNAHAAATEKVDDAYALNALLKTRLAYVQTGNAETDENSRTGLSGLSRVLTARTAVEPAEPLGINIDLDEIVFFPIIYWPVLPDARALSTPTLAKIDAYMKQGGMIVFDTLDYGQIFPGLSSSSGPGSTALQRLLGQLDIPRLEPVPDGHVLTKSFYLLTSFPGRWDGGQLWVEAGSVTPSDSGDRIPQQSDGVSAILITSNDFASAWALDDDNQPLYPVVPGGELQREMAFRVGVNIVMYALTGNYKADQVHVPELLERLGQ